MKLNFSRSMFVYSSLVLTIMLGAMSYGLYHFWHRGPNNIENITSVFEANLKLEEMRERGSLTQLRSLVINDRVREAVGVIEGLEQEIKLLGTVAPVPAQGIVLEDVQKSKRDLSALLSFPELSTVMLVFNNKINNFESYVSSNNWNTLTRTSRRVQSRVTPERLRSSDFYTLDRLLDITSSFERDFELMRNVTTNSVLSNENKNNILTQLDTFRPELDMLRKYVDQLKVFKADFSRFETSYQAWLTQIEPAIALRRIEFEQSSQTILFAFLGTIAFVFFALIGGYLVYSFSQRKTHKKIENLISATIKERLLPIEVNGSGLFSKDFDLELAKYREYVHKRMSFGTIFQEAMPFSSILLDSNLNVVWANSLFFEHWDMTKSEIEDGSTTWDYLQQFTNLGEDDPVLQALNQSLAGIYHIQVRRQANQASQPYEMYVSPVEYAGQKRIMIIFYPLSSMEQTLADQTKSLVGPVLRSLDALSEGVWNGEFEHKIAKDFDIAGIPHVFQKFSSYFKVVTEQKDELLREMESLVERYKAKVSQLNQVQAQVTAQKELQDKILLEFQKVKEDIINIVEVRAAVESFYHSTCQASKSLLKDESDLLSKAKEVNQLLTENVNAFDTVCRVRDEFKVLKQKVDSYKTELIQLVDQALVFQKSEGVMPRLEESLGQIKVEMRNFDRLLASFSKVSTQLDVGLSKVSMILDRNEIPNLTGLEKKFGEAREAIENDMYEVACLMRDGQVYDEKMIHSLKDLYTGFRQGLQRLNQIQGEFEKTQERVAQL